MFFYNQISTNLCYTLQHVLKDYVKYTLQLVCITQLAKAKHFTEKFKEYKPLLLNIQSLTMRF